MWVLLFSCKKDNTPTSTSPNIDSLPIPFKNRNWWKYQRIDSVFAPPYAGSTNGWHSRDSSIELITVIGKAQYVDVAIIMPPVESIVLEVKNLTQGTLDTIHTFYINPNYDNAYFMIRSKDTFNLPIKIPLVEGTKRIIKPGTGFDFDDFTFYKNASVTVLNKTFDSCNYTEDYQYYYGLHRQNGYRVKTYFKANIGFVYWEVNDDWGFDNVYINYTKFKYRRLIDYHIEP